MAIHEERLIGALEPFRGFVLSSLIFSMHKHGLDGDFAQGCTAADLVARRGLNPARAAALLDFLAAAGVISAQGGRYALTDLGQQYGEARGWYEMMIGGYGMTFLSLGDYLAADAPEVPRVGQYVGSGSCLISLHDSIPLTRELLSASGRRYRRLVDLGCGSGVYLTELCRDYPDMTAVGIEPDAGAAAAARAWVASQPTGDRVTIEQSGALEWLEGTAEKPDLAILAFVIHEILGQQGEQGVRDFLAGLFDNSPALDLLIIDIDLKSHDEVAMKHPLAQNYYNAYFLMHPFTAQRLEGRQWWETLFAECGLQIVASGLTDPAMDSTGFEVGWLLRRSA